MAEIDNLIAIWSARPAPGSDDGKAWIDGAHQGWKWAAAENDRLRDALKPFVSARKSIEVGDLAGALSVITLPDLRRAATSFEDEQQP